MEDCAQAVAETSEDELEAAYERLRDFANDTWSLGDAQDDWISFRDSWCDFEASAVDGSDLEETTRASCIIDLNNEQIHRLNRKLGDWKRL